MNKLAIFFHPYFSDGGVERTNLGLAKGLIQNGYKVVFLTTTYTNHFLEEIKNSNIELVSLGDKKVSKTIFDIVSYLNNLDDKKIFFISCQYYVNIVTMIASLLVKNRKNIKFINAERNHYSEFTINGGLKNKIIPYLLKYFYSHADLIIANSQETAQDLSSLINREVKSVYNPTINKRLDDLKDEAISEEWYLEDERDTIIGIGRFSKQKDFDTLIKAFYLFNKNKQYKLVILGDGDLRYELEQQIIELNLQEDIYLPGFVSNPYKFLKQSSLFVLSSRYEGLPNVLIEALYLNTQSIATRCKSGPKEILLKDDRFLVEVGDYKELANKMKNVLANPIKKDFKLDRFQYENIISEFIKVIEE